MILDELTLQNFGLFKGRQTFKLSPGQRVGVRLPVVLVGGMNGSGKTTLLDAIQLALYGPRARCSKRVNLSYDTFLRQSIHHAAAPGEGAEVAVSFRHSADGETYFYEVRRSWAIDRDGRPRETLKVFREALADPWLSEHWQQIVEDLIPLGISQLFFFDAEKIRSLADDAESSAALEAAIRSLLGLDIVERLIADTSVLQARLVKQSGTPEHRAKVEALQQRYNDLQREIDRAVVERASLENDRLRAEAEQKAAEDAFANVGGPHWEARQSRTIQLAKLESRRAELEARLVDLAATELPMALVPGLLEQAADQGAREAEWAEAQVARRILVQRDERLLKVMKKAGAAPDLLRVVREHLDADLKQRDPAAMPVERLKLSAQGRHLLKHLCDHRAAELRYDAKELLGHLAAAREEQDELERALAATPDDAAIAPVVERLKRATQQLAILNDRAARLDEEVRARRGFADKLSLELKNQLGLSLEAREGAEDASKMAALAGRARTTMEQFLARATAMKIDRLSAAITDAFRFLVRKKTLVEQIHIDPGTFAITLHDGSGGVITRHQLSEGEKQIFAVAVLWGLARASARPLPAVIDTPMARLDTAHRSRLVERYFPHASHQVVILSTDTEVDLHYYQKLQPYIARAYHLDYDEETKVTVGREGYFWRPDEVGPRQSSARPVGTMAAVPTGGRE